MSSDIHPCLHCGVCCQNYRVEFSIYELQSMGGTNWPTKFPTRATAPA